MIKQMMIMVVMMIIMMRRNITTMSHVSSGISTKLGVRETLGPEAGTFFH